jgi:hypothetical protein
LNNQCQQGSLPYSKIASTKDFSNTQGATCQLPAFEKAFISVAFPVHFQKKCLT